jgi:hypothetical protein
MALLIAFGVSGCFPGIPPTACTTIGWSNAVEVNLDGSAVADVDRLGFCIDHGCLVPTAAATPFPETGGGPYLATELGGGRWRVEVGMSTPEEVTIEAFAADGRTLGKTVTKLEWRRVGGSEECGGPAEASPINLEVS